jgi:hypothetical protein
MAVVIPDDNREPIPVGMHSWDFATSICCDELWTMSTPSHEGQRCRAKFDLQLFPPLISRIHRMASDALITYIHSWPQRAKTYGLNAGH